MFSRFAEKLEKPEVVDGELEFRQEVSIPVSTKRLTESDSVNKLPLRCRFEGINSL